MFKSIKRFAEYKPQYYKVFKRNIQVDQKHTNKNNCMDIYYIGTSSYRYFC